VNAHGTPDPTAAPGPAGPIPPAPGASPRPRTRRVLFFSDCHLGTGNEAEDRPREDRIIAFLQAEGERADAVYMLGDLFDFWFEYRHAVPRRHLRVLNALGRLVEQGIPVTFFGGNHDFWAGSFLEKEIRCRVTYEPIEVVERGRGMFLAHGDALTQGDRGYLFLRAVLRNRWAIAGYRLLHPDLGIPLARWSSRLSRHTRDEATFDVEWLRDQVAAPRFAAGFDAVLVGHFHHPRHLRDSSGRDFLVLGDWIRNDTYAVLEDGDFTLLRWVTGRGERLEGAGKPLRGA
jgi:UDP-2,3-diacylglucosamine hydrolase